MKACQPSVFRLFIYFVHLVTEHEVTTNLIRFKSSCCTRKNGLNILCPTKIFIKIVFVDLQRLYTECKVKKFLMLSNFPCVSQPLI